MSELHIFRGLPGSGKTTAARKIAAETGAILIEPDALLIHDGEYKWSPVLYRMSVQATKEAMIVVTRLGCDVIYADVLPSRRDTEAIIACINRMMKDLYSIVVHDLKITVEESLKRNRHNVRREDIERMAREWEDWK